MRFWFRSDSDKQSELQGDHTVAAIKARLHLGPRVNYLRDWVYGGIDGAVTTFAILAGVAGASLSPRVMLIVGFANLLADGFALAAGDFTATRTEHDNYKKLWASEAEQIRDVPDGEREEIRQIYAAKGFSGDDLERAVEILTEDRSRWIKTMLFEEYGLTENMRKPWLAAVSTFVAFGMCGVVPLIPFMLGWPAGMAISIVLTALAFFVIGTFKSIWSMQSWVRSGLETVLIGMCAASVAFGVGLLLRYMIPA